MAYTPIVATLGYVLSPDGLSVLMIHRNSRPDDHHLGKYNGLGGKIEADEDVAAGMIRELREEAGIEAIRLVLRGTVNWPGFGKNGEHWLGFIFMIPEWRGAPFARNPEGVLEWIPLSRLLDSCRIEADGHPPSGALEMWPGDRFFVPLVFCDDPRQFHGVMPYDNGRPVSWRYTWTS
ncbi:MAG: 8-oxo-dGTP diphosphatase [Anaerolineae bacterium]|nr:8-oxo-dGTP diphosphatase [Thermoflexales bacterium]MDW8407815.1 8-oxo-dGTP diphosphatase [Anaerolineae bacterium]